MSFHSIKRKELQALCRKHKIPANLSNLEMANRLNEHFKEKEKSPIKGTMNGNDFQSMKRRELQDLCKKHQIPANLPNLEMAKRLADFLKENEKSPTHEPINGLDKLASETESSEMVLDFQSMKHKELQVLCKKHNIPANLSKLEMAKRLTELLKENEKSPIHEPINVLDKLASETESCKMVLDFHSMKHKELQVLCKKNNIPANLSKLEMAKRLTELPKENEKPSIQVLINEHGENASETESMDMPMNGKVKKVRFSPEHELFEYTRSPEFKQSRRNSVSIRPSNLSVETVDNSPTNIENVDGQGRVTRSRGLNLVEEIVTKTKRVRRAVDIVDNVPLVSGEGDDNLVVTRRSFRNKGVPVHRAIEPETVKRAPEKNETTKVPMVIEPQIMVKRSKRNANAVDDSLILNDETRKCENDGVKISRKLSKLSEMSEGVLQIEEPVMLEVRRSDRRKSVITLPVKGKNLEQKAEMENMRNSVLGLVIAGGVSKNEKKVPQPITRQSRRNTIITEPVASEEILDTDVAVDNCETEKCLSTRRSRKSMSVCKSLENKNELGGDTIIQEKNEPRKRKRGPTSEGDVVKTDDVRSSSKQSMEEGKNERSVSVVEPQLPESAQAESGSDTCTRNKTVTSDVGLDEFIRKTLREEQVVSIAESAGINFIDGNQLANSEENATLRIAELETDLADSEKSISASNIKDFEFDIQDIVDKDITNMNKNQSEPVSGHEGFAEPTSATESVSLVDLVDHVVEVEEVSVQENLDTAETGETNVISLEITYHHNNVDYMEASNGISEDNKEDIGEVGAPESFADPEVTESEADTGTHPDLDLADDHLGEDEVILVQNLDHIESPNSSFDKKDGDSEAGEVGTPESSALQLKDTSSGNLRIIEGEGDDAETEKEECLNEHKIASDEDDEFSVAVLFAGERSVMNASQDGGIVSGECSAMKSDEQRVDKEYLTVSQKTISSITTNICTMRDLETEHSCRESFIDKSIEVSKTGAGGSVDCHENQDSELLSGENSANSFDENEMDIKLKSCCEDDKISEEYKAENNDNYENRKDEDREFGVSNLFDVEKCDRITQQDRGFFYAVESNKGFNEQVVFNDFPVVSTTSEEVEFGAGSSSSKEISPSKPHSSSKSQGTDPIISDACETIQNESGDANIPDKEIDIAQKIISVGDHGIFNQAEETNIECTPIQAEQPKSPSAITTAIPFFSGASEIETTRSAMFMSQTCGTEITSPVAEGFNANEDGNGGNCGNYKDKWENACNTDADISMECTVNNSGAETSCELESHHSEDTVYHQSLNLRAKPSQSLTEIEAAVNDVTPTGLNDSMNKLDANSGNSLHYKKENEMEEEKGSESAKFTCADYQSRWLFATPINTNSLSEVDKTSRHGKELDIADLSITECVGTAKENSVAQIKSDENEFEKRSSSDTGDGINYEEVNAAESVELANTSSLVLSEASDENLTENACDDEEEEIISLGESRLYAEATENRVSNLTEKIAVSSFGSPRNFDNVEHMDTDFLENLGSENVVSLKSERKLAQSSGAEFAFSDDEIQNPCVLENNHHLIATKENLRETLIDNPKGSMDAEGADIVSCNDEKAVTVFVGMPPSLLTNVSNADDAILPTSQEVSDYESSVDREDYQLRLLFATPIKIDSTPKVNETSKHENDLENSVANEKLRDAENKHELSLRPSSDTGEKINYEESDVVGCVELMNTSGLVLSEASEESVTENKCDKGGLEKKDSIIEVNEEEIISLGEFCLFKEASERGCGLTEENTLSLSGSLKNLDEVEGCQDRLMDTDLAENLGCDNRVCPKSEIKMAPSYEAEFEISDADILGTFEGPMDAKGANTGSFNCEKDMTGTSSSLFPKVSDDDEDFTERKSEGGDSNSKKMDGVDDNSRSLPDSSDEPHNNTLMAILKSPSVANTLEFQSTYNDMHPAAGQGVPVCGAEDGNENGDSEKSDTGTPLYTSGGDHEKNSEGTEENLAASKVQFSIPGEVTDNGNGEESDVGTPVLNLEGDFEENDKEIGEITTVTEVQFPVSELHLEEKIDVPAAAFGCNEFLKECDVANTIKEYIDYELNCMDEMAVCEDGNEKLEESIGGFTDDKLVETKGEEQMFEEMLFKDSGNPVVKEEIESSSRHVSSSVKENARTILIHGTPSKVGTMVDMKENGAAYKSSNIGDFTSARPAKRKALQDVKWK